MQGMYVSQVSKIVLNIPGLCFCFHNKEKFLVQVDRLWATVFLSGVLLDFALPIPCQFLFNHPNNAVCLAVNAVFWSSFIFCEKAICLLK